MLLLLLLLLLLLCAAVTEHRLRPAQSARGSRAEAFAKRRGRGGEGEHGVIATAAAAHQLMADMISKPYKNNVPEATECMGAPAANGTQKKAMAVGATEC